jgi:uncharacterized iron-regulated protein
MMPTYAIALLVAATALASPALTSTSASQQDAIPRVGEYRVYTGSGELVSLDEVVAAMADKEVVFIGESHNDLTGHLIEAELLSRAFTAHGPAYSEAGAARKVTLSLEMFERDVQYVVDEYLQDLITEDQFQKSSRPWTEYETDYRPLIEFAKQEGLAVIAANAPRRYANRVTRHGREALLELSSQALTTLPPLPYGLPSAPYQEQWRMAMVEAMEDMRERCPMPPAMLHAAQSDSARPAMPMASHATASNPLHAQALWDAAMAYSISEHLMKQPDALVLHMVGSFHVERGTGTPEHLARYRPGTSTIIVVMRPVENVELFDPERDGENEDFVILTEEAATRPVPCPGS